MRRNPYFPGLLERDGLGYQEWRAMDLDRAQTSGHSVRQIPYAQRRFGSCRIKRNAEPGVGGHAKQLFFSVVGEQAIMRRPGGRLKLQQLGTAGMYDQR